METLGQIIGIRPKGFESFKPASRESDPKGLIGRIKKAAVSAANRVLSSLKLFHLIAVGDVLGPKEMNIRLIEEEPRLLPLPPARKEPEISLNNGYFLEPLPSAVVETPSIVSIASFQEVNPLMMEPLQPPSIMEQTVTPIVPIEAQVSMMDQGMIEPLQPPSMMEQTVTSIVPIEEQVSMMDQGMIDPLPIAESPIAVSDQSESITPQFITPDIGQVIDINVAPVAVEQTELAQFINIPEVSAENATQITAENDQSVIQEGPSQSFETYSSPTLLEPFVNQTEPFVYEQIETVMASAITEAVSNVISTMDMTQIGPDLSLAEGLFGPNVPIGVDTPYPSSLEIGVGDSVSYQGSSMI